MTRWPRTTRSTLTMCVGAAEHRLTAQLLTYTERLLSEHPHTAEPILHVLCDEFQDTNTVQYLLVKHFARSSGAVTVVGDPDQVRRQALLNWLHDKLG